MNMVMKYVIMPANKNPYCNPEKNFRLNVE
jgi:hypothetical protein